MSIYKVRSCDGVRCVVRNPDTLAQVQPCKDLQGEEFNLCMTKEECGILEPKGLKLMKTVLSDGGVTLGFQAVYGQAVARSIDAEHNDTPLGTIVLSGVDRERPTVIVPQSRYATQLGCNWVPDLYCCTSEVPPAWTNFQPFTCNVDNDRTKVSPVSDIVVAGDFHMKLQMCPKIMGPENRQSKPLNAGIMLQVPAPILTEEALRPVVDVLMEEAWWDFEFEGVYALVDTPSVVRLDVARLIYLLANGKRHIAEPTIQPNNNVLKCKIIQCFVKAFCKLSDNDTVVVSPKAFTGGHEMILRRVPLSQVEFSQAMMVHQLGDVPNDVQEQCDLLCHTESMQTLQSAALAPTVVHLALDVYALRAEVAKLKEEREEQKVAEKRGAKRCRTTGLGDGSGPCTRARSRSQHDVKRQ